MTFQFEWLRYPRVIQILLQNILENAPSAALEILNFKAFLSGFNLLFQHHPVLLDAICWILLNTQLNDVGWVLIWFSLLFQHHPILLDAICWILLKIQLKDVRSILIWFNLLFQHHPILLDATCWIRLNNLLN